MSPCKILTRALPLACSLLCVLGSTVDNSEHYVFGGDITPLIYQELSLADLTSTCLVSKQWQKNTLSELVNRYRIGENIPLSSFDWKLIVEHLKALPKGKGRDVGIRFLRRMWPRATKGSYETAFLRLALIEVIAFATDNEHESQIRKLLYEANNPQGYQYISDLLDWIQSIVTPECYNSFRGLPSAKYFLETESPSYDQVFKMQYCELAEIAKAGRTDILLKIAHHFGLVEGKTVFDMLREYRGPNRDGAAFLAFSLVEPENVQELANLIHELSWIRTMCVESLVGTKFPEDQLIELTIEKAEFGELPMIMGYWPEGAKKAIRTAGEALGRFQNFGQPIDEGDNTLLLALANDIDDGEILAMLVEIDPEQVISKAAFFAVCLGRSVSLVKTLVTFNQETLLGTADLMFLHHIPEHLLSFLLSNKCLLAYTFLRINREKALGPSLTFVERNIALVPEENIEPLFGLLLSEYENTQKLFPVIKYILTEKKGSKGHESLLRVLRMHMSDRKLIKTCFALFLLAEMDEMILEKSLLDHGAQGLLNF